MIKKKILMLAMWMCSANSVLAMQVEETFSIRNITPIKKDLPPEKRKEEIHLFLKDVLKPAYELNPANIVSRESKMSKDTGFPFTICTLTDGSKWVENPGLERYLGYVYLKKGIEYLEKLDLKNSSYYESFHPESIKTLKALETRFAYKKQESDVRVEVKPYQSGRGFGKLPVLVSNDFSTYTRYMETGRTGIGQFGEANKKMHHALLLLKNVIGFTDIHNDDTGMIRNTMLRNVLIKDDIVHIYDTEYLSFSHSIEPYFDENGDLTFTFSRSDLL